MNQELTAMKQCTEYIKGLRYKLQMMANDVNDSKLIKKSQSIAYHFVKEGIATDE